jgi:hypothetical protein
VPIQDCRTPNDFPVSGAAGSNAAAICGTGGPIQTEPWPNVAKTPRRAAALTKSGGEIPTGRIPLHRQAARMVPVSGTFDRGTVGSPQATRDAFA